MAVNISIPSPCMQHGQSLPVCGDMPLPDSRPLARSPAARVQAQVFAAAALLVACGSHRDLEDSKGSGGRGAKSSAASSDDSSDAGTDPQVEHVDIDRAGPPSGETGDWTGFGGSLEQSFARTDAPLTRSNLSEIGTAWEQSAPGGVTGTPVIYEDVVYWTDWVGHVHANNVDDGEEVWTKTYERGFTSSPFVTQDKLFLSNRDNMVYALERSTGEELWATAVSDDPLTQLWSSPTVVDGVAIVGIGGKGTSDGFAPFSSDMLMSFRGGVVGLDAESGEVRWHFDNTVGEDGTQYGPGVSSWSTAAVDTDRKIAYIGAGNSYYSPASPYSDSLLALDYMTTNPKGHLVWHHQFTMDDNFTSGSPMGPDSDVGATPNLYSIDGKDYVSVGDKGGHFYALDRETGELLWSIPVGSGSSIGGVMAPASYADGKLYITANSLGSTSVVRVDAQDGAVEWTATLSTGVSFGAPLLLNDMFIVGTTQAFPSGPASTASVVALDRYTGELIPDWELPIKNQRGGGMSVYKKTLFVGYGFVFENTSAESRLVGGILAAAIGGKAIDAPVEKKQATYEPTYSAIYDEILDPKGCTADRCHGGLGIELSEKDAGYESLLHGAGTMGCDGKKFVVPGKPDESLLYQKVADEKPVCGARMPLSLEPLDAKELKQIRTWIEDGAKDN